MDSRLRGNDGELTGNLIAPVHPLSSFARGCRGRVEETKDTAAGAEGLRSIALEHRAGRLPAEPPGPHESRGVSVVPAVALDEIGPSDAAQELDPSLLPVAVEVPGGAVPVPVRGPVDAVLGDHQRADIRGVVIDPLDLVEYGQRMPVATSADHADLKTR